MRRLWFYYIYLFFIWGSFRYFIHLPEVIEELWFKPVIWLVPLFWWNAALKRRVEMFENSWVETVSWGLGMALFYWLVFSQLKIPVVNWETLGVAMATAGVEELVFSGFITGYLERLVKGSWTNLFLTGAMAGVMRLPIATFVFQLTPMATFGVVLLAFATTMIHAWIRQKTGNVAGGIIARVGMNLAILG